MTQNPWVTLFRVTKFLIFKLIFEHQIPWCFDLFSYARVKLMFYSCFTRMINDYNMILYLNQLIIFYSNIYITYIVYSHTEKI